MKCFTLFFYDPTTFNICRGKTILAKRKYRLEKAAWVRKLTFSMSGNEGKICSTTVCHDNVHLEKGQH